MEGYARSASFTTGFSLRVCGSKSSRGLARPNSFEKKSAIFEAGQEVAKNSEVLTSMKAKPALPFVTESAAKKLLLPRSK